MTLAPMSRVSRGLASEHGLVVGIARKRRLDGK
jgi:hypothetical protein